MSDTRPGPVRRLFVGLWRVLDFSRRFILTIIFLVLVGLVLSAIFRPGLQIAERTALVIAPVGQIVEQYSTSVTDRAMNRFFGSDVPEVQLRDVLKALDSATTDARIERVVLRLDRMQGAGMATLREIGGGIDRVRAAGKQVVAYGDWYGQGAYYLASRASEVYLHPLGMAAVEGLARYRTYYAQALAKLGIEARLFRVGEFKSAAEPYIRNDASPEAEEADRYWMADVWSRYLTDVGAARGLDPAAIQAGADNFPALITAAGGDGAKVVLDAGLVDELKTADEFREIMIGRGVRDDDLESFRQVAMDDYLSVLARESTVQSMDAAPVAIVVAQGPIVDGEQAGGTIGGESTSALIRKAREDDDIKAVVLRIDSPGGGMFPSEQIRREVELTRLAGKPVIASMGDVAASGGYWIAMDADRIYADPTTITGSIGIFGLWFNAPETMAKLGLNTDGVATTQIAGIFDPTRAYDPRVGEIIQAYLNNGYAQFIGKAAHARKTTPEAIDAVARGRVWSGTQARDRGLVDELGGLDAAIARARTLAGLPADARVSYVEPELSTFERFVQNMGQSALAIAVRESGFTAPAAWLPPAMREELQMARAVFEQRDGRPWTIFAHCMCASY
jgi:protease-4